MSIFAFVNFKSKLNQALSNENISGLLEFVKDKIIEQAQTTLNGSEKKSNVDKAVIMFIKTKMTSSNPLVIGLINILIDYVPVITQYIYDLLKKYVDGLTEV